MASCCSAAYKPKAGFRFLVEPSQSPAEPRLGVRGLFWLSREDLRPPVETGLWGKKKKCRWSLTVRCWKETDWGSRAPGGPCHHGLNRKGKHVAAGAGQGCPMLPEPGHLMSCIMKKKGSRSK